jgi:hypothetical protein
MIEPALIDNGVDSSAMNMTSQELGPCEGKSGIEDSTLWKFSDSICDWVEYLEDTNPHFRKVLDASDEDGRNSIVLRNLKASVGICCHLGMPT